MAYAPYYTEDQSNNYYQDPYQGYGGYEGYGYEGYGEPYTPTNPPAPDENWIDPLKVNREYLKKIQKNSVHKGFEGLKENGLFLFEVMVRCVLLKKDIYENLKSTGKEDKQFMTFVKILDTPFVEVSESEKASGKKLSGEFRTNSVLAYRKSFTNLFQTIYTTTGRHDSLILEVEDESEGEGRTESKNNDTVSENSRKENLTENTDTNVEEDKKIEIMKGKSILLPLPGMSMIKKLQQYPLSLKVTQRDVTEDDAEVEGRLVATSTIRLPETFRQAVLMCCQRTTVLPLVAVDTNFHQLTDAAGGQAGSAQLTLVLTCFGKGAVNCVTELEHSHNYEHTFLLRHLKAKHVVQEKNVPAVDPRLAKQIAKMGLFFPSQRTSSEVLQHCMSSNLIPTDEQERKHAQKQKDCSWFHILKTAFPPSSHSFDFEKYMKEVEMETAALWRQHKKICRDLKKEEPMVKKILEDNWRDVPLVQTGVTGVETQNPFEDLTRHSVTAESLKSFSSRKSKIGKK